MKNMKTNKMIIDDEIEDNNNSSSSEDLNLEDENSTNNDNKNILINKIRKENLIYMKNKNISNEDKLNYLLKQVDIYAHFLMSHQLSSSIDSNNKTNLKTRHRENNAINSKEKDNLDKDKSNLTTRLYHQPSILKGGTLKPYQLDGLNWMISLYENKLNGILADEMGLGKTIQSISLLAFIREFKSNKLNKGKHNFIIIVPKSTMPNWNRELLKWCPELNLIVLNPIKEEREETLKEISKNKFDVIITSYEGVNICINNLKKIKFECLIIDEAHRIKNEHALLSKNVRIIDSKFRLLVTGTPLQNNLHELWALLNFLLPDLFTSSDDFNMWFGGDSNNEEQEESLEKKEERNMEIVKRLHKILKPFLLRRTKNEVEKTLPPKKEIHIKVGLSEMQKDIYKKLLKKSMDSETKIAYKNIIMQLRKCCNHPYLFEGVEDYSLPDLGEHLVKNSSKMRILEKLIEKLKKQNNQVLIFSQMTRLLDILEDYLVYKDLTYCRIDGNTSLEDREKQIADFTKPNSEIFAFLLSTRAGGLGINLMSANTVVLYDSDWNPQVDLQAMDRVHRIGQTKTCLIYRFICENTIEEKIIERQAMRLKLDSLVIQQGRSNKANETFSKEQMKDMIQYGADAIFKAGDDFKDEDIDILLERGEKLTGEFYEKVDQEAKNKSDLLLNFNNTGGVSTDLYIFEDEDYLKKRQEYGDAIIASRENDEMKLFNTKRDRNLKLTNMNFDQNLDQLLNINKVVKKKYKTAKAPYHHLYQNRERLLELKQKQINLYLDNTDNKKLPEKYEENFLEADEELSKEELNEMKAIAKTGFPNWDKKEYDIFISIIEKNGYQSEDSIKLLCDEIETKSKEEISKYLAAFLDIAKELPDGIRILKQIDKRNRAYQLKELSQKVINYKVNRCNSKDNWEMIVLGYPANSNRHLEFNNEEDMFLIWLTYKFGYGNWEDIIREIRLSDDFMFNYYLKSRDVNEINKRVDYLVKTICKEYSNEKDVVPLINGLNSIATNKAMTINIGDKNKKAKTSFNNENNSLKNSNNKSTNELNKINEKRNKSSNKNNKMEIDDEIV